MTDGNKTDRGANLTLDRKLLHGYFSLLILALLAAAIWATAILSHSNLFMAAGVAAVGVVVGLVSGRSRRKGPRAIGILVILGLLTTLSALAGRGHSYQFAWLFPALTGLLLARPEWPWWRWNRTAK